MVDLDVVDDYMGDVLNGETTVAGDLDVSATAVDGFVTVDDQFVPEVDEHVGGEDDPERFGLDDGVTEGAWGWVGRVSVGGVGDYVDLAAFSAEGSMAEADGAVGQALPVIGPVRVAPPAVVNGVSGEA